MAGGRGCPVRDNIWVKYVAYLTARPCSREYSFFTNIPSLTGEGNLPPSGGLRGVKTSLTSHYTNKTTSVAQVNTITNQPHYLINTRKNQRMHVGIRAEGKGVFSILLRESFGNKGFSEQNPYFKEAPLIVNDTPPHFPLFPYCKENHNKKQKIKYKLISINNLNK